MPEIIDLYDDVRRIVSQTQRGKFIPAGLNRLMVHVWFVNSNGEFLLQQRPTTSKKFPNMWGPTGGGVQTGESSWDACVRECTEEIGIVPRLGNAMWVGMFKRPKHFIDVWMIRQNIDIADIKMQSDEVQSVQWVRPSKIMEMQASGEFIPSTKFGYCMVLKYLQKSRPIIINPTDLLNKMLTVKIDHPLSTTPGASESEYPVNYGIIPGIISANGDALGAYVLGPNIALKRFSGRVIAVVRRTSDKSEQLVVVPNGMDMDNATIEREIAFREKNFDHEIIR